MSSPARPPHRSTPILPWCARLLAAALPLAAAFPGQAAVVISQVYGGGGNSGATIRSDFIELRNAGAVAESIGGWSVQYASATGGSWAVTPIPAGTTLQPGQYYLVGEATGGNTAVPVLTADTTGTIALSATAGKVALVRAATALSGTAASGSTIVDFVGFGSTAGSYEGSGPAPAPSNTTAVLRKADGCTDTGDNAADFGAGTPLPRASTSAYVACGEAGGGGTEVPPVATAATIPAIQGRGDRSPLAGRTVVTSSVVTLATNTGFFIQDLVGDGDPATSDGLYVYTATTPPASVAVGNRVEVTGRVAEYAAGSGTAATPMTELENVSAITLLGTGYTIAPTTLALPLAAGDGFERHEGMLVRIPGTMTVQQNYFQSRYGQLTIGVGRHETPTNRYRPGSPEALALADLQARSRLLLDDASSVQNPNPTPFGGPNGVPRAGDTVGDLVGVLDFGPATSSAGGAGLYRLQATATPTFTVANPRPATPPTVGAANLRVASMNVLNFFTTFTDGRTADGRTGQGCALGGTVSAANCRGADNLAEFLRQRAKLVQAIAGLDADAVGLMELQNDGNGAAQNLVDALNARVGAGTYATVPVPPQGTGSDAIRVGMLYKPARLALAGAAVADVDAVNNRPPLAQTFAAPNGERFTLVVNHLKSKGSCPAAGDVDAAGNTDAGDGQGCWNATRLRQAQRLRTFVAQLLSAAGTPDVLLIGDFNAYAQEDPIRELTSAGYVDESARFESFGHSYVFDGTAGRLDHAIGSASLSAKVTATAHWHIDADESPAQDYNTEFKVRACAACPSDPYDATTPYRASDHDPVLVGLALWKTISGTAARDTLVGTPGDDILIGGPGADTVTGGGGANVHVYTSMRDAGDTITDFVPGQDRLDLRTLLAVLGYTGTAPVADGWVRFVAVAGGTGVHVTSGGAPRPLVTLLGVPPGALVPARDLIVR